MSAMYELIAGGFLWFTEYPPVMGNVLPWSRKINKIGANLLLSNRFAPVFYKYLLSMVYLGSEAVVSVTVTFGIVSKVKIIWIWMSKL